jgi:PAS domain S-box-containing protein
MIKYDMKIDKKEELLLKESENKFQSIFNQAAVGIARLTPDGKWIEVNQKLCDIVGYSQKEIVTKAFQDITHPDDLEKDLDNINQLLNNKIQTYSMEKRYFKKNGDLIWVNLTVSLVRDAKFKPLYFISIIEDITKRKNSEKELHLITEALKKSEKKLQDILNSLSIGVVVHDLDTSIVKNNLKAAELLGLTDKQLTGMKSIDVKWKFLDKDEQPLPIDEYPVNKILNTKTEIKNILLGIVAPHADTTTWVLVNGFPVFDDQNEILEIIINFIDISELKQKDEILINQSKLASMGEMIGNIAHQWRQPLSVISTAATGMKMQKEYATLSDEEFAKTCDIINNNAQYLSNTIDDFRNFIKGERKKTLFDLTKDIGGFLHLVEGSIKSKDINIIFNLQNNIEIDGYENELTQCFLNIFNNAKDILIEKEIEHKLLFITTNIKNDKVIIKMKDNAGGIPKKALPRIFEPYFTTKHKSQGTGLGLSMTHKLIVEGMKGTIEAFNVSYEYEGKDYTGAEFVITLPIKGNL